MNADNPLVDNRRVPIMSKGFRAEKPKKENTVIEKKTKSKKGKKKLGLPLQLRQQQTATGVKKIPAPKGTRVSRVKTATIAKPPEGKITQKEQVKVELLNETDEQKATNVMNKPDNTDLDKLDNGNAQNTDEANQNPSMEVEIRKDIQKPRVAEKTRKSVEPRVMPDASVEAMNDYGKGPELKDRFSSLNQEPQPNLNKVDMDIKDNDRLMNSELNKFGQFERNDNILPEGERMANKEMAKVSVTGNKEYVRNDETQMAPKPLNKFDHEMIHIVNNPYKSHEFALHPNSSNLKGFYLA